MQTIAERRRRCKAPADPEVLSLAAFYAVRNFLKPLLRARQQPSLGVDHRTPATEAIGDMLMYICALHDALGVSAPEVMPVAAAYVTAEEAIAGVIRAFSHIACYHHSNANEWMLRSALQTVLGLCDVCCIAWVDAAEVSLRKLECCT